VAAAFCKISTCAASSHRAWRSAEAVFSSLDLPLFIVASVIALVPFAFNYDLAILKFGIACTSCDGRLCIDATDVLNNTHAHACRTPRQTPPRHSAEPCAPVADHSGFSACGTGHRRDSRSVIDFVRPCLCRLLCVVSDPRRRQVFHVMAGPNRYILLMAGRRLVNPCRHTPARGRLACRSSMGNHRPCAGQRHVLGDPTGLDVARRSLAPVLSDESSCPQHH